MKIYLSRSLWVLCGSLVCFVPVQCNAQVLDQAETTAPLDSAAANTDSNTNTKPEDAESTGAPNVKPRAMSRFLQLREKDGQPTSLDTAIVSYRSPSPAGVQVDLIGAVHVGEREYYAQLNERFESYDILLYELVAPEGTQIPKGGKRDQAGFNPVAMLQDGTRNMLSLESQLEQVDYTKANMLRADMTPTQIAEKMAERGDTAFTIALDTLADVLRQQNKLKNPEELANKALRELQAEMKELSLRDVLGNPLKMKRLMAKQFAATGVIDQAMGETLNQLLIVDRNAAALGELQKQIASGKKRIGVFYGAAHLPDLENHLLQDFGLVRAETEWLPAWDLTQAKPTKLDKTTKLFLNVLDFLE